VRPRTTRSAAAPCTAAPIVRGDSRSRRPHSAPSSLAASTAARKHRPTSSS
jgi:hypothetical protein